MTVPFFTLLSKHIRFLLQSLDGSNSDAVFRDLSEITTEYGADGSILLLCACLDHIDIYAAEMKNIPLDPAIVSLFKYLLKKPNFSTVICQSVRSAGLSNGFLDNLSDAFCLSVPEKIAVGLALSGSDDTDIQYHGENFFSSQIEVLFSDHDDALGSSKQITDYDVLAPI